MKKVKEVVSGEKYLWVMGDVVLKRHNGVVVPLVVNTKVHGQDTPEEVLKVVSAKNTWRSITQWREKFLLDKESVLRWGYDLNAYSAYTIEDTAKYVWYTTSASRRYALGKQGRGRYSISMVALDNGVDASTLVGNESYMLSEAEVDNSVYDADKFIAVGKNGVRGPKGNVSESETEKLNYTRYQLSDKFKEARDKGMVYIPVKSEEEASILRTVIDTENGYNEGFDDMLLVYSTKDAQFRPLYKYANAKEMSVEEVVELAPTSAPTRRPEYRMSEEFYKLHNKDIVAITVDNKEQADILTGLLPIDGEFQEGDGENGSSEALVVYPEHTGYGADFTMMIHLGNYPIMPFAKAVVELAPTTLSTDGDAGDVISAPYVPDNGTALDLSDTPIGTDELPSAGITSAKINLGYRLTDKFKEALSKGVVDIPVDNAREAGILSTLMEIGPEYKYESEYNGGALIAVAGIPAMFSPFYMPVKYASWETVAFGDAVEPL